MTEVATQAKPTLEARVAALPTIETMESMGLKTTAAKVRYMRAQQEKEDRGAIAKALGIRYQWVRNILTQVVKEA